MLKTLTNHEGNLSFRKFIALFYLLFFFHVSAHATTIFSVSLDEMLLNSEFVFEGKVIDKQAVWTKDKRDIKTIITFEVLDVIKGSYQGNEIKLSFSGGEVDGIVLKIGEMHMPERNETGIYFVEAMERKLVHPLYGWSQGHFLIEADSNKVERVKTQHGEPVMSVKPVEFPLQKSISEGVARGIQTNKEIDGPEQAMSKSSFKQMLHEKLQKQDE